MKWLYFFRHGETDYNREHRFQGHLDIPLNATGREQAHSLIGPLQDIQIQAIISSDLSRAFETGAIIASALNIPIVKTNGLREAHLGRAEGLTAAEIEAQFGRLLVERWKSPYLSDADVSYPGGESGSAVLARVLGSLESFVQETSLTKIGVATHGGVIRRVVRHLLGDQAPMIPIPNGILYPVGHHPQEGWKALTFNPIRKRPSER